MKKVYICSPLRGTKTNPTKADMTLNMVFAAGLCREAVMEGVAPFAPHIFYTQFLDDENELHRFAGIQCGMAFLRACEEVWVYTKQGISEGMKAEIALAERSNKKIVYDPACWNRLQPAKSLILDVKS